MADTTDKETHKPKRIGVCQNNTVFLLFPEIKGIDNGLSHT